MLKCGVTNLNGVVLACRQAYAAFQQLASRTDDALYHALAQVHALRFRMRRDKALQASFDQLVEQHAPSKTLNGTLFLTKYAFFPHTLQPGPGHKAEITKASRYAKLINKALEQGLEPTDFVQFARTEGIQRTAVTSSSARGRSRFGPGRRRAMGRGPVLCRSAVFLRLILKPLDPWFATAALATRIADLR
jgi:hypothetical protein